MKVHNLLVTGSLTSGGENIGSISSSVATINNAQDGRLSSLETTSGSIISKTGSFATTGSNVFVGNQTISGSIVPAVNGVYDLGSSTHEFRHLYLSSASLYIDGTKVLGSTTQELQITTDTGQSFKILEAGSDTITLQAADGNITLATSGGGDVILDPTNGVVALKGTTTLYAGNKILSSDGNAIQFGNSVTMTGSLIVTGYIETQELRTTYISSSILYRSGSTKFGDEVSDTHAFTGSLLISGSVTTVGPNVFNGTIRTNGLAIGVAATDNVLNVRGENSTYDGTISIGARSSIQHRDGGQTILSIANDYNSDSAKFEIRMKGNTSADSKFTILGSGVATLSNTLQVNAKLYLQRESNGADTLLQFKNEVGADRAYIKFGGTNEELAFYAGAGGTRNMIIGSDGAMGFNYPTLAVRSFMFRALADRPLAIEITESGGIHSVYLRPNPSGRHLITSNYLSGGVYLPLALSGRENDTDLVLKNGNVGINDGNPSTKLSINGANYVEMATFTTVNNSAIITNNSGYVASLTARHNSNSNVFSPTTNGIQILKAGLIHVTVAQDIRTAGTTGYAYLHIRKNETTISENLITNTNTEWDMINGHVTVDVAANDIINFYYSAADILALDTGSWSQYSFIWSSR